MVVIIARTARHLAFVALPFEWMSGLDQGVVTCVDVGAEWRNGIIRSARWMWL